jgi:four helix bundle protein
VRENVIAVKTYAFSLAAIKVYQFLVQEKKEFVLAKQFVRAATSIGANVEESIGGQSEKDFSSKLNIAYKEARECHYWLRLFKDSNLIESEMANPLLLQTEEIQRILGSSIKTLKSRLHLIKTGSNS